MTIRTMRPDDVEAVVGINSMNLGDVDPVSADQVTQMLESGPIALVAEAPDIGVVGFAVVIDSGSPYRSERADWALKIGGADLHLERVAFDMTYSGLGLGLALYNELDERILTVGREAGAEPITLTSMVRVEPPNRHAIDFHTVRGFETVDQADFGDSTIAVARKTYDV